MSEKNKVQPSEPVHHYLTKNGYKPHYPTAAKNKRNNEEFDKLFREECNKLNGQK